MVASGMTAGRSPVARTGPGAWAGRAAGCALLMAALGGCALSGPETADSDPGPAPAVSATGSYLVGRTAYRRGDIDAASIGLAQAADADPANSALTHRLFLVRLEQGRVEDAVVLARRLHGSSANTAQLPLVLVTLGLEQVRIGNWHTAVARFDAMAGSQMGMILKHLLAGWALAGAGDWAGADARLSGLARLAGMEGLSLLHRGYARILAGAPVEGRDLLARAMELDPRPSLRLRLAMALALASQGEVDAAREALAPTPADGVGTGTLHALLDRAAAGLPAPGRVTRPVDGMAEALFDVASALRRHERTRTAEYLRGQVLALAQLSRHMNPRFVPAALLSAQIHASRNDHDAAVEIYGAVPATSPYYGMSRLRAARSLFDADRVDEAIRLLEDIGAERPRDPTPWAQIGDMHRRQRQWEEAVTAYAEALDRVDAPAEPDWKLFYYHAVALERADRWPEAEASFLRALDLSPDQAHVLNYLGYTWTELGVRLDEAERMLRRAVALEPEDGYIIDSLGWVLLRTGRVEQAVPLLEQAVRLQPADATINDHLGDAYWRAGRREEAVYQWNRADGLDPEPEQREEIRAKIRDGLPDGA